jgi:hypothetical protein
VSRETRKLAEEIGRSKALNRIISSKLEGIEVYAGPADATKMELSWLKPMSLKVSQV